MRLAVSHTFFNKKLDEYGHGHDAELLKMMELEKAELIKSTPSPDCVSPAVEEVQVQDDGTHCVLSDASRRILDQRLSLIKDNVHPELEIDFALPVLKTCARKCH